MQPNKEDISNKISFLNHQFLKHENCLLPIEDRSVQFADSAYEVILYFNDNLVDFSDHFDRFQHSLDGLEINYKIDSDLFLSYSRKLFLLNNLEQGTIYWQITRGTHKRIANVPNDILPTIIATVNDIKRVTKEEFERGFKVIIEPDLRWQKCNLKTTSLIASSLTNQKAKNLGYDDAIMFRDNKITEATFANVFVVKNGKLFTPKANNSILNGITRRRIMAIANERQIETLETDIAINQLLEADEIFLTSSSLIIRPILEVFYENKTINLLKNNVLTKLMRECYKEFSGF